MVDLRAHVNDGFAKVDTGFAEMRGKFDALGAGQQRIVDLLTGLGGRDEVPTPR